MTINAIKMYKIIRFYKKAGKGKRTIKKGLTLEEARRHCKDPKTLTNDYFDGYEKMRK